MATPGHYLYTARDAEAVVGSLWIAELPGPRRVAYIYDIFVDASCRGRGFGEATMRAAEAEALRLGLTELKLHVFADNAPARALYQKLGYQVTNLNLSKRLSPAP